MRKCVRIYLSWTKGKEGVRQRNWSSWMSMKKINNIQQRRWSEKSRGFYDRRRWSSWPRLVNLLQNMEFSSHIKKNRKRWIRIEMENVLVNPIVLTDHSIRKTSDPSYSGSAGGEGWGHSLPFWLLDKKYTRPHSLQMRLEVQLWVFVPNSYTQHSSHPERILSLCQHLFFRRRKQWIGIVTLRFSLSLPLTHEAMYENEKLGMIQPECRITLYILTIVK